MYKAITIQVKGSPKFLGETPKSLVETLGEKQ